MSIAEFIRESMFLPRLSQAGCMLETKVDIFRA